MQSKKISRLLFLFIATIVCCNGSHIYADANDSTTSTQENIPLPPVLRKNPLRPIDDYRVNKLTQTIRNDMWWTHKKRAVVNKENFYSIAKLAVFTLVTYQLYKHRDAFYSVYQNGIEWWNGTPSVGPAASNAPQSPILMTQQQANLIISFLQNTSGAPVPPQQNPNPQSTIKWLLSAIGGGALGMLLFTARQIWPTVQVTILPAILGGGVEMMDKEFSRRDMKFYANRYTTIDQALRGSENTTMPQQFTDKVKLMMEMRNKAETYSIELQLQQQAQQLTRLASDTKTTPERFVRTLNHECREFERNFTAMRREAEELIAYFNASGHHDVADYLKYQFNSTIEELNNRLASIEYLSNSLEDKLKVHDKNTHDFTADLIQLKSIIKQAQISAITNQIITDLVKNVSALIVREESAARAKNL